MGKLKSWWNDQSKEHRMITGITALIVGCGFVFYNAGLHDGQTKVINALIKSLNR